MIKRRKNLAAKTKRKVKRNKGPKLSPFQKLQARLALHDDVTGYRAILALKIAPKLRGGRHPFSNAGSSHRVAQQRYENIQSASTAITAHCAHCNGDPTAKNERDMNKSVRLCGYMECPLWPFRLGGDPF